MSTPTAGPRAQQGEATRARIVEAAVNRASMHGLESLSIGELAKELEMSKSGLFAHFGSKEELQIAAIEAAEKIFHAAIIDPACGRPAGVGRLWVLLENYMKYLDGGVFPGGCFFSAAAAEFDDRPGRVRDRIAKSMRKWHDLLSHEADTALANGELRTGVEPQQLVFELKAFTLVANFHRRLLDDRSAHERAKVAIRDRLSTSVSKSGRALLAN